MKSRSPISRCVAHNNRLLSSFESQSILPTPGSTFCHLQHAIILSNNANCFTLLCYCTLRVWNQFLILSIDNSTKITTIYRHPDPSKPKWPWHHQPQWAPLISHRSQDDLPPDKHTDSLPLDHISREPILLLQKRTPGMIPSTTALTTKYPCR